MVRRLEFLSKSGETTGAFLTRSRLGLKLLKEGTSDCSVENAPQAGKSVRRPAGEGIQFLMMRWRRDLNTFWRQNE